MSEQAPYSGSPIITQGATGYRFIDPDRMTVSQAFTSFLEVAKFAANQAVDPNACYLLGPAPASAPVFRILDGTLLTFLLTQYREGHHYEAITEV